MKSEDNNQKMNQTRSNTEITKKITKKVNPWKWIALFLIALILGCGIFVATEAMSPAPTPKTNTIKLNKKPSLNVTMTKKQVNTIVNFYIKKDQKKKNSIKYDLYADQEVVFKGTFPLLGHDFEFTIYFDPFVKENGDVQLKAKRMAIGQLSLPISYILSYISKNYDLPKWVAINSKSEYIDLQLTKFKTEEGAQILAKRINLEEDKINFEVFLPLE